MHLQQPNQASACYRRKRAKRLAGQRPLRRQKCRFNSVNKLKGLQAVFGEAIACLPDERDETARLSAAYGPIRVKRWANGRLAIACVMPNLVTAERSDGLNVMSVCGLFWG
jgi:hypothetical protein